MISVRLKNSIRNLIAKGETKEAITKLQRSKVVKSDQQLKEYTTLIAAWYQRYKRDQATDINSAEFQRKNLNRINNSILLLVDGELKELDRMLDLHGASPTVQPQRKTGSKILIFAALLVSLVAILTLSGLLPTQSTTKATKISYELNFLTDQGAVDRTILVKIYDDLSGEFINNGKVQKISKIVEASDIALDFTIFDGNEEYRYASFLPELSRVEKRNFTFLDGALYYNGQFNRKWRATIE
ncbi:MAG: hypothetical protein HRU41_40915 [Saprospiraceae bacterium]|nr:hypothetical protein [Saprospiraceae bacterium]